MPQAQVGKTESLLLETVRGLVYGGAALLFTVPLTSWTGCLAALSAIPLGFWLTGWLAARRVRGLVIGVAILGLLAGCLVAEPLLCRQAWLAHLLGFRVTLELGEILTFGLLSLGVVVGLRTMAVRCRAMGILEAAAVVAAVTNALAGHRDSQISQPRWLADWAFGRGYEPWIALWAIGVVTLGAIGLLLLERQRLAKTLAALASLAVCCLVSFALLFGFLHLLEKLPEPPNGSQGSSGSAGNQGSGGNGASQGSSGSGGSQASSGNSGNRGSSGAGQGQGSPAGGGGNHASSGQQGSGGAAAKAGDGVASSGSRGGGGSAKSPQEFPFNPPPPKSSNRPQPVAIVSFHHDYTPPHGVYYFRQDAFSQFNGARLIRSVEADFDADVPGQFPTQHQAVPRLCALRRLVDFCAAGNSRWPGRLALSALGGLTSRSSDRDATPKIDAPVSLTISLITSHSRPFSLANVESLDARQNADPKAFSATYHQTSRCLAVPIWNLADRKAGEACWTAAVWKHYLAMPDDRRYRELAEKILASSLDEEGLKTQYRRSPVLRALAIGRWIEKNVIYAKHHLPKAEGQQDPTATFLFGQRRGYCVHIAHAMAYMMRALGIPARVAGGYAAETGRRGQGSSLLLQDADAHAWCEIYLRGVGWVVTDASPERSEEEIVPPPDLAMQTHYGEKNHPLPELEKQPEHHADRKAAPRHRWPWQGALPLLAIAGLYGVKAWRRVAPRVAPRRQLYRVCYRVVLDRLAEVGVTRQFGETREEFAGRLARWAPEFAEMTAAHVRRAVAGREDADRRGWLALQSQVLARINAVFPAYRRLLGALRPLPWLRVR
jgi:hypothetical protein